MSYNNKRDDFEPDSLGNVDLVAAYVGRVPKHLRSMIAADLGVSNDVYCLAGIFFAASFGDVNPTESAVYRLQVMASVMETRFDVGMKGCH